MNYKFVTAVHGNEPIPVFALADLNVKQYIANKRALIEHRRFIDADLNSVFGVEGKGYEYDQAKEMLNEISPEEKVIDLHSFSAVSEPFVVVVNENMIDLAIKTGLSNIVIMEHNIKNGHALINYRKGISVEIGHHKSHESFIIAQNVYKNLLNNFVPKKKPSLFRVFGIITEPGEYVNFTQSSQGFYPVLAGEKAYDFYGLKAKKESL